MNKYKLTFHGGYLHFPRANQFNYECVIMLLSNTSQLVLKLFSSGPTMMLVIGSAESSGKGMTETLRGLYSLTETIGNGKTMLTFRSPETLRRPLASETVSDWII